MVTNWRANDSTICDITDMQMMMMMTQSLNYHEQTVRRKYLNTWNVCWHWERNVSSEISKLEIKQKYHYKDKQTQNNSKCTIN